jgi:hypothetical protein
MQLRQIQSNILTAILNSGTDFVNNEYVLNATGISRSTWGVEQNELVKLHLLRKVRTRSISNGRIFRSVNYWLTEKGREVALNLLDISAILESNEKEKQRAENLGIQQKPLTLFNGNEYVDISDEILESIDIAIGSYGTNFLRDVRSAIEKEHKIQWIDIVQNTDKLSYVLRDFFGVKGARTVESMICADLRARFGLESRKDDCLQSLISGISMKEIRGITTTTIIEE